MMYKRLSHHRIPGGTMNIIHLCLNLYFPLPSLAYLGQEKLELMEAILKLFLTTLLMNLLRI